MNDRLKNTPDYESWMPEILKDDDHRFVFFKALDSMLENLDKIDAAADGLIKSGVSGYGLSISSMSMGMRTGLKVMLRSLIVSGDDFMDFPSEDEGKV